MRHKSKRFLILFFFLFFFEGNAQQKTKSKNSNQYVSELIELINENIDKNGVKANSYLDKALKYENKLVDSVLIKLYDIAGKTYLSQESYYLAIKYYNEELILQKNNNSDEIFLTYNNIGNVYYRMNDYEKANQYWVKALAESKKIKNKSLAAKNYRTYNNIAILEHKVKGNLIKALEMFTQAKTSSQSLKDTAGIIMAYQNLAIVNLDLKERDSAFHYMHRAKIMALKANYKYDLSHIYYNLGDIFKNIIVNNDSAKHYLLKAFELSNSHDLPLIKRKSSESLSTLYEEEKQFEKANYYLRTAKSLSEETIAEENKKKINQLELKYQQSTNEQELILEQKRKNSLLIISSIVLFFVLIITFLILNLQKSKLKFRKAENQLLARQIEEKNKEITGRVIQIMQTSEVINATHKELSELKRGSSQETKKMLSKIITDLRTGSKGFNKAEFEKLFIETHQDFYKNLLTKYPDLTRNELRLCAFLKMNLSTKEISAITQQSENSLVIARHRLRKKLNLDNEKQSLTNYLVKF